MLSARDNDFLTLVGPGTPMGDLVRRYWIPVVLSDEVAAGGRVKRVQLLGERLVVHRTPTGRAGVIAEF
jgi:phthalate 4,5-dioxygenase oxygenase subunit